MAVLRIGFQSSTRAVGIHEEISFWFLDLATPFCLGLRCEGLEGLSVVLFFSRCMKDHQIVICQYDILSIVDVLAL